MKILISLLLLGISCHFTQDKKNFEKTFEIQLVMPQTGIRVYDEEGLYLGKSPVKMTRLVTFREVTKGIWRYFDKQQELFPGGNWPLRIETFKEGTRISKRIQAVFHPDKRSQTVEVSL